MAKDVSPEERLLKLIKNKAKPNGPAALQADIAKTSATIASKADERISGMLKSDIFKGKVFEPQTLKSLNKYLFIVLGVLALYLLIDLIFVRPYKNIQALISKPIPESTRKAPAKKAVLVKDYSSYSTAGGGAVVFGQSPGEASTPEEVGSSDGISEKLGLVGIITGDNPQAIVEDKKAQKTYYLNKGQSFNGYVVEVISEGKIVLDYGGRKISLFL
jgi:type II secretory pathway component PulC